MTLELALGLHEKQFLCNTHNLIKKPVGAHDSVVSLLVIEDSCLQSMSGNSAVVVQLLSGNGVSTVALDSRIHDNIYMFMSSVEVSDAH